MNNIINYIKHSNIILTFVLNPFNWLKTPFYFHINTQSDMDPGLKLDLVVKVLFLKIVIYVDDGRW